MARLPVPYTDLQWGPILNDYLLQAHTDDGKLRDNTVGTSQLQDGSVTPEKLTSGPVTFNGPVLAPNLPRRIVTGKTPPANPQDGDIWFDTSRSGQ